MSEMNLKYQPVIKEDGVVSIHETIVDDEGQVKAATYEAVKLEANSIGELEALLRKVYRHLRKTKPITEDELEAMLYGVEDCTFDDDDKIIDLCTYFADPQYSRS